MSDDDALLEAAEIEIANAYYRELEIRRWKESLTEEEKQEIYSL